MSSALLDTLRALKTDTSVVVRLYNELYEAAFFVLIRVGTGQSLETAAILTYDTADGVCELPVFTEESFILQELHSDAEPLSVDGPALWSRLVDLIETRKCEVGVDPGQAHGIRLNKEMVLGMIMSQDQKSS